MGGNAEQREYFKEVLPSLLLWAPELPDVAIDSTTSYVDALELCNCDGQPKGYYVHHYASVVGVCGQAFGPLALDQVYRFCRRLKKQLASHRCGGGPLCLTTAEDEEAHTNCSVLLGAYLILVEDWSSQRVADVLGSMESRRKFACSWAKPNIKESSWLMTVAFCWDGLEVAKEQGWIDTDGLNDDDLLDQFCAGYRTMVATYDAAWIVPGKVLVSADPVTTLHDPNPETFVEIFASKDKTETDELLADDLSPVSTASTEHERVQFEIDLWSPTSHGQMSQTSVITVNKDYVQNSLWMVVPSSATNKSSPYSTFLRDCGVSLVIRANFVDEPGMPRPSYDAAKWKEFDIDHENIQFEDKSGGLPTASSVASLLEADMSNGDRGSVLIHCKGGFGRSIVLSCCLIIYNYNVPGSALLGWCRIARPGAITTRQQELFLLSMHGRADVLKFTGKLRNKDAAAIDGTRVSCGCAVQ
jgi:hypothetical protein